jgi:hypothetical protein
VVVSVVVFMVFSLGFAGSVAGLLFAHRLAGAHVMFGFLAAG